MISPAAFVQSMQRKGIDLITGVPDSLLKELCSEIQATFPAEKHLVAASEGAAVGLAIGHYLAKGSPAVVYLQNSGLGNIINPVTSLAAKSIYAIPIVFLIGWRGELTESGDQLADEPQHVVQGKITTAQLDLLDIPYLILDANSDHEASLSTAIEQSIRLSKPFALLIRKGSFAKSAASPLPSIAAEMSREEAIEQVLAALPSSVPVVSTTGMASREVFEIRKKNNQGHSRDFLVVGGMGHAVSIASGISYAMNHSRVVCLDGDGALMMHSGSLSTSARCPKLLHVVLNNEAHDSVGGQLTSGSGLSLTRIATSFGYHHAQCVHTAADLQLALAAALKSQETQFIEVMCRKGNRSDLGRPDRTPLKNREEFQAFLSEVGHG